MFHRQRQGLREEISGTPACSSVVTFFTVLQEKVLESSWQGLWSLGCVLCPTALLHVSDFLDMG